MTRPWNLPDLRNGTTIHHLSDTQQGFRDQFTDNWCMRIAEDMQALRVAHAGHVHTGDCVEGFASAWEDPKYQAFRAAVMADGMPYLDTPGNHDLATYNAVATTKARSANDWASQVPGRAQANQVMRMGDMAVIGISPHWWRWDPALKDGAGNYGPPDPWAPDILSWLDAELGALSGTTTWLATHALPLNHEGTPTAPANEYCQPWDQITALLDAHPHVIGWLSGHWHIGAGNSLTVRTMQAGSRKLFSINAPSSQGIRGGYTAVQQQTTECAKSMFITYLGDAVDLRWRDHTGRRWMRPFGEQVTRHQLITI